MKRLFLLFALAVGLFAQAKPGYDLSAPKLNTRVPQLQAVCGALQAQFDLQYLHGPGGVDNWYAQVETWINANMVARSQSPDPERYSPTPWTMKVPERTIADYDNQGVAIYKFETDPRLVPPTLPPYVKPTPSPGFVTDAGKVAAAESAEKAAMFNLLLDIQKSVAAIKAKLGIQ